MIWFWILPAVLISTFLLRKKHISFQNYLWVLLPIDMYGISVAGVTIKPYMAFCIVLLIWLLKKDQRRFFVGSIAVPFILLGTLIVNTFNGGTITSLMSIFMVILVYLCANIYASSADNCMNEIPEVIVATSIGYGIVFSAAYMLFQAGVSIPGLVTNSSKTPGIIIQLRTMDEGAFSLAYRLRGFNIDPNASVGLFLAVLPVDISALLMKQEHKMKYLVSFAFSLACIFFTNSRMGFFAATIIVIISGIKATRMASEEQQGRIIRILIVALTVLVLALLFTDFGERILNGIFSTYGNRADFSAEHGRGSIWKETISVWFEKGFFFGIGTENIRYLISLGKQTHNTWLEWLCGCGILAGSAVVIFFFLLLIRGFNTVMNGTDEEKILFQTVLMGFFGMVVCLFTVDNITNSYLWFFAITLMEILSAPSKQEDKLKCIYLKT